MTAPTPAPYMPVDHFAGLARRWSDYGPPLRPTPFDTNLVDDVARALSADSHVVVLGLTPETIGCAWPPGTRLHAFDHSAAMIRQLWPNPRAPAAAQVVRAEWLAMPLPDGGTHLVCADGCHTQVSYPEGFAELAREVARVLRPGGLWVTRTFLRPDTPEDMTAIAQDMANGTLGSVHALRLRLFSALHQSNGYGTRMHDVWLAWRKLPPLHAARRGQTGWTDNEVQPVEAYRDLETRYYMPVLNELRGSMSPHFDELACHVGQYELAERCPTLVLRKR